MVYRLKEKLFPNISTTLLLNPGPDFSPPQNKTRFPIEKISQVLKGLSLGAFVFHQDFSMGPISIKRQVSLTLDYNPDTAAVISPPVSKLPIRELIENASPQLQSWDNVRQCVESKKWLSAKAVSSCLDRYEGLLTVAQLNPIRSLTTSRDPKHTIPRIQYSYNIGFIEVSADL
jgi:hypothetical protein